MNIVKKMYNNNINNVLEAKVKVLIIYDCI